MIRSTCAGSVKPSFEPIDVFTAGQDDIVGVKNAWEKGVQFREQNVVETNNVTLVAVCQVRNASRWSDSPGQDLVVNNGHDRIAKALRLCSVRLRGFNCKMSVSLWNGC